MLDRVHRRLAQAADRGVAHDPRQFLQQRLVPVRRGHQLHRLFGADAARRALAAALILEKAQQVERHRLHVVLVGEHDNRGRAGKAAVRLERAEIERDVGHRRRQDAARGAARQIALERVAVGHAAAEFVDQLARGDPGRGELDAGLAHPAGHREGAQPLAPVAALAGEPVRRPSRRCRAPSRASRHCCIRVGRPKRPTCAGNGGSLPRQPALALDAFEHRRFFAADIGAGAAAQMDARMPRQPGGFDRRDLAFEDRAALRVFVAQIDVDLGGLDRPGGDQHPFEKAVRVGFEEIAVLEGAGLALVAVDRQQPRRRLLAHQPPFAPGRKAGAAEPAQARMLERFDHLIAGALARQAGSQQAIAAADAVVVEADKGRDSAHASRRRRPRRRRSRRSHARATRGRSPRPGPCRSRPCTARARPARHRRAGSADRSAAVTAPASSQLRLSQTRTVSAGGGASSSMTMSKWA